MIATAVFLLPAVVTDATVGHAGRSPPVTSRSRRRTSSRRSTGALRSSTTSRSTPTCCRFVLEPVLKTFHSSLTSVSIALCTLSAIALLSIFGVFKVVTRGSWTALALFLPFLALALFPWNDDGPYRNFDANYYGILPRQAAGAIRARLALRGFHPALDPDLGAVRLRRPGVDQQHRVRPAGAARPARRDGDGLRARQAGSATARALRGRGRGRAGRCGGDRLRGHPAPSGGAPRPHLLTYFTPPSPARFVRPGADAHAPAPLGPLRHLCRGAAARRRSASSAPSRSHPDGHARVRRRFGFGTGVYFVGRSSSSS